MPRYAPDGLGGRVGRLGSAQESDRWRLTNPTRNPKGHLTTSSATGNYVLTGERGGSGSVSGTVPFTDEPIINVGDGNYLLLLNVSMISSVQFNDYDLPLSGGGSTQVLGASASLRVDATITVGDFAYTKSFLFEHNFDGVIYDQLTALVTADQAAPTVSVAIGDESDVDTYSFTFQAGADEIYITQEA